MRKKVKNIKRKELRTRGRKIKGGEPGGDGGEKNRKKRESEKKRGIGVGEGRRRSKIITYISNTAKEHKKYFSLSCFV